MGTLLVFATLILSTATAIEWNYPSGGEFDETVDVSFNAEDHDGNIQNVTLFYQGPSDENFVSWGSMSGSLTNYSETIDIGNIGSSGEYDVKAAVYNPSGLVEETDSRAFTLDETSPSLETSQNYVRDGGTFEFTVSDDYTQVVDVSIQNTEDSDLVDQDWSDACDAGDSCDLSVDVDTGDIDDGNTLDLSAEATDDVGNTGSEDWDLTVDNDYEADDSPEVEIEGADDSNNVMMESDEDVEMTVSLDSGEDAPVGVKCFVGGEQINDIDYESFDSDESQDFTCDIEGDEYAGGTSEVYVEACDEAGNCIETDETEYAFDSSKPFVTDFDTVQSYKVFNDDFKASFDAGDDASGIDEVEYVFDLSTQFGEGNSVEVESGENFTVDTSSLERGSHTIRLRAQDAVGRWSDSASVDFEFYPNSRPQLNVKSPGNVTVTAGGSKTIDVEVSNPGKLFVESAKLTASAGEVLQVERDLSGLAEGESETVTIQIDTASSDVGKYTLNLQTDQPQDSVSTTLLVEANQDQEQNVESRISNYTSKLEGLNSNISELRKGGLAEDLNRSLNSNVSGFTTSVQNAEQYAEQGDYYRALSALEGIDAKYEKASQTYSDVEQQHLINERNRMLKMLGGLVFVLAIGGGFYFARNGDYELDLSEYRVPEMGGVTSAISEKVESLGEFIEEEEEEAEQKFQGFN
jgi:hypothetical protein